MTLLQLQHQLDGPDWRETVLRYALYSSFVGLVFFLFAFRIFAFSQNQLISTLILGFPTIFGSLLFLQLGHRRAAVWFYLIGANVGDAILSIQQGNPNHIVPLSATIVAIVIISVTGSPLQTCVTGLLSILINLTVTWLLLDGRWLPFSDVVWSESFTSIGVYLSILIPLVATSWIITVIINQLQDQNDKLQRETRARIERELHNQINWFRKVIDGSPDIFVVFDEYGKLTDINETGLVELGYTRAEIIGMPISELDADWSAERMQEQARTMQQHSKQSAIVQGRNQRKDGSIFPVEVASSLLMDGDKRRRVGFIRNITDRLEAEKALQESEEKYRTLFNRAPVMIHSVEIESGMIIDVNDYWLKALGYDREEVIGKSIAEFVTPMTRERFAGQVLPEVLDTLEDISNIPADLMTKNGAIVETKLSSSHVRDQTSDQIISLTTMIDVTELNRVEKERRKQNEWFRSVIDKSQDLFVVFDEFGKLVDINSSGCKRLGYRRDEVIGLSITDLTIDWSPEQMATAAKELMQVGGNAVITSRNKCKDGSTFPVEVAISVLMEGEHLRRVGFARDISSREAAENAIRESEKRYRDLYNQSPVMMHSVDGNGELIDVNDYWTQIMNYSREEVLNTPVARYFTPESMQKALEVDMPTYFPQGHAENLAYQMVKKEGEIIDVSFSAINQFDKDGEFSHAQATVIDVTAEKALDRALQESEEKFRSIFNTTPVGMYLINAEGFLTDINDRWLEMTGYRREEMIGQRSVDFLTPGSRKQALEVDFPNFFKRGYIKNLEIEVMRKDGTILDILLNGSIRKNEEGEYDGAIASLVDITEQNRLRAAVAHTERRFQAVFNNTFSFIGLMEPDGTLIEANEAAYSFGNLTPEEVLGVPFWEALWWQHSPQVQIDLRNAIQIAAKGDFVRYEVDVQGGDGQLETIDFSIKPIFDEEGNVNLLVPEGRMITTLKQTEAKLIQSEKRFRALFNDSSDFTLALSPEGVVQDANDRVDIGTILGRDGFMGRYLWDAAPFDNFPQTGRTLHEMYLELISDNVSTRREIMMASRIHGDLYLDIIMTPIFDESNNHLDMIIVEARDVTSLVQTREALRQSADDNQVLLKEVHHRVKNNLQIIISMLRTHIRSSPDEAIQISYREIMSRVQSMSLIHQQLYQKNSDLDDIELDLYMHQLLKEIMRTYKIPIDLHIDVAAIKLDIDRALTCGLIVNELATNALKYAFPERRGSLSITGRQKNGKIMLEVADDGIGLDPEIKLEHATSTGFQLIYLMKQQLAGELSIFRNNGTHFRLTFPYLATG